MNKVLCGDMREVLRTLKDGSVDMCVTSPPYFGQRAYAGETEAVWGGEDSCEHVWGEEQLGGEGYADGSRIRWQSVGGRAGMPEGGFKKQTARGCFCQRCGAWYGELGREPSVELYIEHMMECFREVWRVLSPYGTLWLNLGGCYAGSGGAGGDYNIGGLREGQPKYGPKRPKGYKPLDYIPVPHLVAMALQREGWYWRSTIVWHKPAPMPGSMGTWRWERCRVKVKKRQADPKGDYHGASTTMRERVKPELLAQYEPCPGCPKCEQHPAECNHCLGTGVDIKPVLDEEFDNEQHLAYTRNHPCPKCGGTGNYGGYRLYYGAWRPTTAHEMVFMFSKTNRYYCDQDAVRTPSVTGNGAPQGIAKGKRFGGAANTGGPVSGFGERMLYNHPAGANARSVQSWPTANLGLDHFAAFSVELAAWCIRAGTSARGYCPKCSRPWVRVVDKPRHPFGKDTRTPGQHTPTGDGKPSGSAMQKWIEEHPTTTLGWWPTCDCQAEEHVEAHPDEFPRTRDAKKRKAQDHSDWLTWRQRALRRAKQVHADDWPARKGKVCDPFGGAGTVGLAAKGLGRSYILCEISEEYVAMSEARIRKGFTPGRKRQQIPEEQMRLWEEAD